MTALGNMIRRAKAAPKHIVLAEGHDPRIIEAGVKAAIDKLARVTLLGEEKELRTLLRAAGDTNDVVGVIAPHESNKTEAYAQSLQKLRAHKGLSLSGAKDALKDPINFANMMVREGDADGSIAGAINSTSDVVRSALQIIGVSQKHDFASSLFIMVMTGPLAETNEAVIYSDCGLFVDPNAEQLAQIALAASDNARALLNISPKIALLSFATHDSAQHADIDKVREAARILKNTHPKLEVDGPLQFDAAISPEVAKSKARGSAVAGRANVLIFPDLNAGNIGYKIAERTGGAKAIGPILQGLAKPANDLSRGCDAEAVYNMIAITALQAQSLEQDNQND